MPAKYGIPPRLVVVLRPEVTYTQDHTAAKFVVRHAFVVDREASGLVTSAKTWGGPDATVLEIDNTPWTDMLVLGVEHRREGGVALKVLTTEGWLVDLREDEFMEAALVGTLVRGHLTDQYVWSRGSNQMRLVRVGGRLHTDRLAYRPPGSNS